jgi:hypothetical protein
MDSISVLSLWFGDFIPKMIAEDPQENALELTGILPNTSRGLSAQGEEEKAQF